MLKNLLSALVVLLLSFVFISSSCAAIGWITVASTDTDDTVIISDTAGAGITLGEVSISPNVVIGYGVAGATGSDFVVSSYNTKGSKQYAANSFGTNVYMSTGNIYTAAAPTTEILLEPPTTATWTSTWQQIGK